MGLIITPHSIVAFDTAPLIYLIERNPAHIDKVRSFFSTASSGKNTLVTSMITYIEVLTLPQRMNDKRLAAKYRSFLVNSDNVSVFPLNIQVADRTIQFRSQYKFKTPDAIQLAVAEVSGADYFLTNDHTLKQCAEVNVVLVEEL